jgi:hypothetical protein
VLPLAAPGNLRGIGVDLSLVANNQFSRERRLEANIEVKVVIHREFLGATAGKQDGWDWHPETPAAFHDEGRVLDQ